MVAGSGLVFAASDDAGGVSGRGGCWGGKDVRVTIPSSFGEIGEVVRDKTLLPSAESSPSEKLSTPARSSFNT